MKNEALQYNWRGKNLTLHNLGPAPGTVYTEAAGGPPGPRSFALQKVKNMPEECLVMVLYRPSTKKEGETMEYAFYHWDGISLKLIK